MNRTSTLALCAALALAGCATPPARPAPEAFGPPPVNVDAIVAAHLRAHLKDPESARTEIVAPPAMITTPETSLGPFAYGWGICARVNAKNSFGAYTGYHLVAIVVRGGQVVQAFGDTNSFDRKMAAKACADIAAGA